jgi:phosphomannomutase
MIAQQHGIEVRETPVGFKFIGEIMVAPETKDKFIIGGEESGGLSIRGHVPEKDGILACLLMAEMVATEKKSIKQIVKDIESKTGHVAEKRVNYHVTQDVMDNLKLNLKNNLPDKIAGIKVNKIVTLDGFKFVLDDKSWVGVRLSGTEPVVRLYLETTKEQKIKLLQSDCERIFKLK